MVYTINKFHRLVKSNIATKTEEMQSIIKICNTFSRIKGGLKLYLPDRHRKGERQSIVPCLWVVKHTCSVPTYNYVIIWNLLLLGIDKAM